MFNFFNNSNSIQEEIKPEHILGRDRTISLYAAENQVSTIQHHFSSIDQQVCLHLHKRSETVLVISDYHNQNQKIDSQSLTLEYNILLEEEAQFKLFFQSIKAMQVSFKINVYLKGDKSSADLYGLYALAGKQKMTLETYQYHQGQDSKSNLVIKGILTGKSNVSYQGLIKIDKNAARTDASQEHKTIVLDKDAKVVSIPSIEVLQHDVACCHGTAIGKFRLEDLWYLQSKGISHHEAHNMLIHSFFQDVVMESDQSSYYMELVCQKLL